MSADAGRRPSPVAQAALRPGGVGGVARERVPTKRQTLHATCPPLTAHIALTSVLDSHVAQDRAQRSRDRAQSSRKIEPGDHEARHGARLG